MRIEDDILDIARRAPDRPAIEAGDRTWTFGGAAELTRLWAQRLREAGLRTGHPVWLLMPNSPEFILAGLAVLRAGGAMVPVNPRLTDSELRQLAASCPPAAIWCPADWRGRVRDLFRRADNPLTIAIAASREPEMEKPGGDLTSDSLTRHVREGEPGVVYFTSGSTGRPKAILLTHENISSNVRATAAAFGLRPDDRTVVCMQMCHSYTWTKQVLAHLGVGATLILAPDFFQPAFVLDLVDRRRATTLCAVPSMHVMMFEVASRGSPRLPTLRLLTTGGSPIPDRVQLGWCEGWPHVAFISSYGLSEASPCVTSLPPNLAVEKVGSVGRAIPGVQLRIADDGGYPLPAGQSGEVCVRGPNVMVGYLNDPISTAEALRDGWLRTGDMGWLDADGCLYLHGRRDDLILRGSENVYPAEIEIALTRHPDVLDAAAIGVPHALLGHEIEAFVTVRDRAGVDVAALREHCRRHLAGFKVPKSIQVVEALPRTPNGKLARRMLRGESASPNECSTATAAKESP